MKKIISGLLTLTIAFSASGVFASFSDIDSSTASWAGEATQALESMGVINGYEDGTFRPHGNVTRAEFAKMLCIAFDSNEKTEVAYGDISGHWAREYIEKTVSLVYTPSDEYNPDSDATRAEIAYALAKTAGLEAADGEENKSVLGKFSDSETVEEPMKGYVASAVEAGFVTGYEDGTIKGDAPVTRAETAVLIYRAMNYEIPDLPEQDEATGSDAEENVSDKTPPEPPKSGENSEGPSQEIYDKLIEKGHIYTLYPQKDFLLVTSATMIYDENGDEDYKLKYYVSGTGDEFESVVDGETVVAGLRSDPGQIRSGDVLILDTAFWGEIGCLYVIGAAKYNGGFAFSCPSSEDWGEYPSEAEYEVIGGKLISAKANSKSYTLEVQTDKGIHTLAATGSASVDIYDVNGRRSDWESDSLSALVDSENTYVLVRFSDGRATEVTAFVY